MAEQLYELKLYSPITAELYEHDYDWDDYDTNDYSKLCGADLVHYEDLIREVLERECLPEEGERGLMRYYHETDGVNKKVQSVIITAEVKHGRLWGVAQCQVRDKLTDRELHDLKEYLTGQYSDGFGEGFEQRELPTGNGELYVHLWQFEGFSIRTRQELEAARKPKRTIPDQTHKKGGDAR